MRGQRGTDLHTDGGGDACSPAGTFLISPVLQRRQQHEVVGDLLQCGGGGAQVEGWGGEKTGEIGPVNYMDRGIRVFFVLFMEDLGSAVSTNRILGVSAAYPNYFLLFFKWKIVRYVS